MSLTNITVCGNLVRDPEIKTTAGGSTFAKLTVAVNVHKKVDGAWADVANYVDVTAWERVANYISSCDLAKGSKVCVTGRLDEVRAYMAKSGEPRATLCMIAEELEPMSRGTKAAGRATVEAVYEDEPLPF